MLCVDLNMFYVNTEEAMTMSQPIELRHNTLETQVYVWLGNREELPDGGTTGGRQVKVVQPSSNLVTMCGNTQAPSYSPADFTRKSKCEIRTGQLMLRLSVPKFRFSICGHSNAATIWIYQPDGKG